MRTCLATLTCLAVSVAGCAKGSEPDPETADSEACAEEARKVSGYRGVPVRTRQRIQMRNDLKWETFYRVYDECMRECTPKSLRRHR